MPHCVRGAAFDVDAARRLRRQRHRPLPLTQTNEFLGRAVVRPRVVLRTPEVATHPGPAVPGSEPEPESDAQSDRAGRGPRWARGWGHKWDQWRSGSWMGGRRRSSPPPQRDGGGGGPSPEAGGDAVSAHGNEGEVVGVHWISMMSGSRRTGDVLAAVQLVQVCGRKPALKLLSSTPLFKFFFITGCGWPFQVQDHGGDEAEQEGRVAGMAREMAPPTRRYRCV